MQGWCGLAFGMFNHFTFKISRQDATSFLIGVEVVRYLLSQKCEVASLFDEIVSTFRFLPVRFLL